jgi:ubiquinol-cytochrome c reductase cytochrome c subunit
MAGKTFFTLAAAALLAATMHAQSRGAAPAAPAAQGGAQATTGDAARGKALYESFSCYSCHGFNGQTGNGARLVPSRMNQQVFVAYLRAPKQMPPYTAKILSDAQAADIFAFIQTLPRAPEVKDIPLLRELP